VPALSCAGAELFLSDQPTTDAHRGPFAPSTPRAVPTLVYVVRAPGARPLIAAALVLAGAGGVAAGVGLPAPRAVAPPAPAALAAPASAATSTTAASTWRTVEVHGEPRRYLLATPSVAAGPVPLLLVFHGLNQHTVPFLTSTRLVAAARAAGVALAAPETPDASWNDGRFGPRGRDDDGFALAVVRQLVAAGTVDPGRVTVAGFSNGAGMAMEIASRHPDSVAALVSVCGTLLAGPGAPRPHAPVDATFLHGTRDRIQPWNGRGSLGRRMPAQLGEAATIRAFLAADGLTGPAVSDRLPRRPGSATGPVLRSRWASREPGHATVTLFRLDGAGHTWPVLPGRAGPGTLASDVDATSVVVGTAATARRPVAAPTASGGVSVL